MGASALKLSSSDPQGDLENLTSLHKALADSLRLQILRLLKNESFGVLELSRILDIRQSALSHHLKVLATAGLVRTRREGNSIFYRRAFLGGDEQFASAKRHIFENIDALPVPANQARKIKQIQLERSQLSLGFFRRNADKFREQQGLIVEHDHYANNIHDVITGLGLAKDCSILEVGPGEGQLLVELAENFRQLTALD
ncbi:MAG: metalloregulator ArsR/SmtB family transcription factor, partial [Gammaproteobacteria bacterium]